MRGKHLRARPKPPFGPIDIQGWGFQHILPAPGAYVTLVVQNLLLPLHFHPFRQDVGREGSPPSAGVRRALEIAGLYLAHSLGRIAAEVNEDLLRFYLCLRIPSLWMPGQGNPLSLIEISGLISQGLPVPFAKVEIIVGRPLTARNRDSSSAECVFAGCSGDSAFLLRVSASRRFYE